MSTVNVSLQIVPFVADEDLYSVVDDVIALIASRCDKYEVGPMETTMEGELDDLLEIVKDAQEICISRGAERILSYVKIGYKKGGVTMDEKIGKYRK